jgi:hypothetical protein
MGRNSNAPGKRLHFSRVIISRPVTNCKGLRGERKNAATEMRISRASHATRGTKRKGGNMGAEIIYGERVVGEVRADGYFQKRLQFSRHLLKKPRPSIAINVDVLRAAEVNGAHSAEIIDAESGTHYRATIATIRARGFRVSRGQGPQIALPLTQWATDKPTDQATSAALPETPGARQLSFWN